MSQLTQDFNLPPVVTVDGFVSEENMLSIAYGIETSLNEVGDAIGNLYGLGDYQFDDTKFTNSIATDIGSRKNDPAAPFGQTFSNFTDSGVLTNYKTFTLTLVPDIQASFTIDDGVNSTSFWNLVATPEELLNVSDFTVTNRELIFQTPPTSPFSITYSGNYPTVEGLDNGYMPNVIPNPNTVNSLNKPTLTLEVNGRIRVSVGTANGHNVNTDLDGAYDIVLSDYLQQFIDGSGNIVCPKEYISAYKYDSGNDTYVKIDSESIYIIANNIYEIATSETINLATDIIVISIANMSLWEYVETLVRTMQTHSHDGSDISTPLSHANLLDLIVKGIRTNVKYGKSSIPGNDHPNYFNREGYTEDPATLNNAIVGDVFISSKDDSNLFNNADDDSYSLIFGSTDSGHVVKRRYTEEDLNVASTANGVSVSYNSDDYDYGLRINNHNLANKNDGLFITSNKKAVPALNDPHLTTFGDLDGTLHDIKGGSLNFNFATINNKVTLPVNGSIQLGVISLSAISNNLVITSSYGLSRIISSLNIESEEAIIDNLTTKTLILEEGAKVLFGTSLAPNSSYFTTIDNKCVYVSNFTFDIRNTGRLTGLNFQEDASRYLTLYASAENGSAASLSNNNGFIEITDGGLYLIKPTDSIQEDDGVQYSFQSNDETRIDNLTEWPRVSVFAKSAILNSTTLNKSNGTIRNGIAFGGPINIFATSSNALYPGNALVVESPNGVFFTQGNDIDFNNVVYSDIKAKNITGVGNLNISGTSTFAGDVVFDKVTATEVLISESFTTNLDSTSTFYGNVIFGNSISFNDDVAITAVATINTLIVSGNTTLGGSLGVDGAISGSSLEANGAVSVGTNLDVTGTATIGGTAAIGGNTTIGGTLIITKGITAGDATSTNTINGSTLLNIGSFQSNVSSEFTQPVTFSENTFFNNAITANEITISGTVTSSSIINANIINGTALTITGNTVLHSLVIDTNFTTTNKISCGEIETTGNATINGDIRANGKLTSYGETVLGFGGSPTKIYDTLEMAGGNPIDCSNGYIRNLAVEDFPYDYDAIPSAAITNPKDAVNREFVINEVKGAIRASLLKAMYPVGTIYYNATNSGNPGEITGPFGEKFFGSWIPYGEGRVLIGAGTTDETDSTDSRSPGYTAGDAGDERDERRNYLANNRGGAYRHVLTVPELAEHTHSYLLRQIQHDDGDDSRQVCGVDINTTEQTGVAGANVAHNNVQPWKAVFRWVRIA